MAGLKIGRQRRPIILGVAAPERLPGEIIFGEREIAGELFEPRAQDIGHRLAARQCVILRGGNAESEKRRPLRRNPANEAAVEKGREFRVEDRPLFCDTLRGQQHTRIDAVQARRQMRKADEAAEQAAPIDPACEAPDPAPSRKIAPLPISPADRVEMRRDIMLVVGDIRLAVGIAEKAAKAGVIGQALDRGALQMIERDMRGVEIDRDDLAGVGGEIGEDVTAAACDRRDPVARFDRKRLHVDHRVFPYLGIDKALEGKRKGAVEQSLFLVRILADDGGGDLAICLAGHGSRSPGKAMYPGPRMTAYVAIPAAVR